MTAPVRVSVTCAWRGCGLTFVAHQNRLYCSEKCRATKFNKDRRRTPRAYASMGAWWDPLRGLWVHRTRHTAYAYGTVVELLAAVGDKP